MQRTYYEPDDEPWEWWQAPEITHTDGIPVRHGFTMGDLNKATRFALQRNVGWNAFTPIDRYEIAWSAVVAHLYEAEEPPTFSDLVTAGWYGISEARLTEMRHHGVDFNRRVGEKRRAFATYAHTITNLSTPPEERVTERLALEQIWPLLTEGQREALAALATHGTATAAAEALGKDREAFHKLYQRGRNRFQSWWFEGETVPARRGRDRRRPSGEPVEARAVQSALRRSRRRRSR